MGGLITFGVMMEDLVLPGDAAARPKPVESGAPCLRHWEAVDGQGRSSASQSQHRDPREREHGTRRPPGTVPVPKCSCVAMKLSISRAINEQANAVRGGGLALLLSTRLYARRLWKGRSIFSRATENGPAFCECFVCTKKCTAKCRPSYCTY